MKNEELVHSSFWEGVTEGIMKFHFDTKIDYKQRTLILIQCVLLLLG